MSGRIRTVASSSVPSVGRYVPAFTHTWQYVIEGSDETADWAE